MQHRKVVIIDYSVVTVTAVTGDDYMVKLMRYWGGGFGGGAEAETGLSFPQ